MVLAGPAFLRTIARALIALAMLSLAQSAVAANVNGIVYGDGSPLESAQVNLYDQSTVLLQSRQTDVSGAYQFDSLAAGTYFLNVEPPTGSPYATTSSRQVDVASSDVALDFLLVSASYKFSGFIRDQYGTPIDGLRVNAGGQSANGEYLGSSGVTDSTGYYEMVLAPAEYRIDIQ